MGRTVRVPKRDLVSVLQVLFHSKRLKIAAGVNERDTLLRELANFSAKITQHANDTYEAWREGQHDDLVLALALASWSLERGVGSPAVNLRTTGLGQLKPRGRHFALPMTTHPIAGPRATARRSSR